jgi:hypothetical protein
MTRMTHMRVSCMRVSCMTRMTRMRVSCMRVTGVHQVAHGPRITCQSRVWRMSRVSRVSRVSRMSRVTPVGTCRLVFMPFSV